MTPHDIGRKGNGAFRAIQRSGVRWQLDVRGCELLVAGGRE